MDKEFDVLLRLLIYREGRRTSSASALQPVLGPHIRHSIHPLDQKRSLKYRAKSKHDFRLGRTLSGHVVRLGLLETQTTLLTFLCQP